MAALGKVVVLWELTSGRRPNFLIYFFPFPLHNLLIPLLTLSSNPVQSSTTLEVYYLPLLSIGSHGLLPLSLHRQNLPIMFRTALGRATACGAVRSQLPRVAAPATCQTPQQQLLLRLQPQISSCSRFSRSFTHTSNRMAETRTESDAFGELQVPADKYWGAQTERSLENFRINQPQDRMPPPIVKAFGILKGAAAKVNIQFGLGKLIVREIRAFGSRGAEGEQSPADSQKNAKA